MESKKYPTANIEQIKIDHDIKTSQKIWEIIYTPTVEETIKDQKITVKLGVRAKIRLSPCPVKPLSHWKKYAKCRTSDLDFL